MKIGDFRVKPNTQVAYAALGRLPIRGLFLAIRLLRHRYRNHLPRNVPRRVYICFNLQFLFLLFVIPHAATCSSRDENIIPKFRLCKRHECESCLASHCSVAGFACAEGVRLADERSEELCEAKSQEPERRNPLLHAVKANALSTRVAENSRGTWQTPREVGGGYLSR